MRRSDTPSRKRCRLAHVRGIDEPAHGRHPIRGDTYAACVLADCILIRREVHAGNLVFGDVAVEPLDLRPHVLQDLEGPQGERADLRFRQLSGARHFSLDDVLRHDRRYRVMARPFYASVQSPAIVISPMRAEPQRMPPRGSTSLPIATMLR